MKDAETARIESENKEIRKVVESDGWNLVKQDIETRIASLSNAYDLDTTNPEQLARTIEARKIASGILKDFVVSIEGRAQDANESDLAEERLSYVVRKD